MDKIKVLELCHFSAGICGVWNRVKEESIRLSDKGYEVRILSSNAVKGSNKKASLVDKIGNVKIKRFPYIKLGGESFMFWDFVNEAIAYSPDIIITHVYRHMHTTAALRVKKELAKVGKKCFVLLVTHAPFNMDNSERGIISNLAVDVYDTFIGKRTLNKFDKVITISHWEVPYLLNLGVRKDKLFYLPNGVPNEFFKSKPKGGNSKVLLFLGRISPIKNLESLIEVLPQLDKKYILELVGPSEKDYSARLIKLAKGLGVNKMLIFSKAVYGLKEKIAKIDSAKFFILPSKREGMPQSLIEAMSRGRICIGSSIEGIRDLIKDNSNGFVFGSSLTSRVKVINEVTSLGNSRLKEVSDNTRVFASRFNWDNLIQKLDKLIKGTI